MFNIGYKINSPLSPDPDNGIEYIISLEGNEIYKGRVYLPFTEIDISDICREYLIPNYEDIIVSGGLVENSVATFTVTPGGTYQVCYNYNTDYELETATGTILNAPINDVVDPRMLVGTSTLTDAGISVVHSNPTGNVGSTITVGGFRYRIVAPCPNRYAIYYVNKNGGIDYLLCSGRSVNRWRSSRTEGRMYANRNSRTTFENTRLYQDITKSYELNTGFILDDDLADKISHLFAANKIWIHNLDEDTITACLISDSSYSEQSYSYDRDTVLINYSFTIEESKLYIRK